MGSSNPHYEADPQAFKKEGQMTTINPRGLNIVWGGDKRYWNVPNYDGNPAELLQVCWLEVTGHVDNTDPVKNYEVSFNVSLTPDAFGWGGSPVYIMVKRGKAGNFFSNKYFLTNYDGKKSFNLTTKLQSNEDKQGSSDPEKRLYFGLYEVWSGKWKGGLKIHKVTVTEVDESELRSTKK